MLVDLVFTTFTKFMSAGRLGLVCKKFESDHLGNLV